MTTILKINSVFTETTQRAFAISTRGREFLFSYDLPDTFDSAELMLLILLNSVQRTVSLVEL